MLNEQFIFGVLIGIIIGCFGILFLQWISQKSKAQIEYPDRSELVVAGTAAMMVQIDDTVLVDGEKHIVEGIRRTLSPETHETVLNLKKVRNG